MSSAKSLRVNYTEVATRGATAPVAGATWTHDPVLDFPLPDLQMGTDTAQEANAAGVSSPDYPTVKHASYGVSTRIMTGSAGTNDTDPTSFFQQKKLDSFWGGVGVNAFSGTTVGNTSGAGKTGDLVVASTTNCVAGQGILVAITGGSPTLEMRFITKVVDATHLTLNADLNLAPSSGDVVYGGMTWSMTLGEYAKYLYWLCERDGHSWLIGPGKCVGLKISKMAAKNVLNYDWTLDCNDWTSGFAPSSFVTNAFLGNPIIASAGYVTLDNVAICIAEGSVDFGVKHEDQLCATGVNGSDGLEIVDGMGTKATVKKFYAVQDWTDYVSRALKAVMIGFTVGSTNAQKSRGGVGIFMPACQLSVKESTVQSQVGEDLEIMARDPAKSTDAVIAAQLTKQVYMTVFGGN